MVPRGRLELPHLAEPEPKSGVSTIPPPGQLLITLTVYTIYTKCQVFYLLDSISCVIANSGSDTSPYSARGPSGPALDPPDSTTGVG